MTTAARTVATLAGLVLVVAARCASADVDRWTSHGPFAGDVETFAIDRRSSTVYVGTGSGVFKSSDGISWRAASAGLPAPSRVFSIVVDPRQADTLYAGTDAGVFKSSDGALTWTAAHAGRAILALAVANDDLGTLYAAPDDEPVMTSTDGGASWDASNEYPSAVHDFAVDPAMPATLYAASAASIAKTVDGGQTWREEYNAPPPYRSIGALALDPVTGTLYAAAISSSPLRFLVGDVFRIDATGAAFTGVPESLLTFPVLALAADPTAPDTVYASTFLDEVFKTTDGGATWTSINAGLPSPAIDFRRFNGSVPSDAALAVDPGDPQIVYFGASQIGAFRSVDGGDSWTACNAGMTNATVVRVAADPSTPATVYAAVGRLGVSASTDYGAHWTTPHGPGEVLSLLADPANAGTVYAAAGHAGVLKSIDGGQTWSATGFTDYAKALAADSSRPGTLFVAGVGVHKSSDGGAHWAATGFGRRAGFSPSAMAIDPLMPDRVYVAGNRGIRRSDDAGETWTTINDGLPQQRSMIGLAIDPADSRRLYAVSDGPTGRLFSSIDGGDQWSRADAGLENLYVSDVVFDPHTPGRAYVGTSAGVFVRGADDDSWHAFNAGLTHLSVRSLAADASRSTVLYAATVGGGVYALGEGEPVPTSTPTATAIPPTTTTTRLPTNTRTATASTSSTPTLTHTPPAAASATATATLAPTPSATNGASATPSSSPESTATATPRSSLTPPTPAAHVCAGDCDGNAAVTVDELLTLVNLALGIGPPFPCRAGDGNGDGAIAISDLVAATNRALKGCTVPLGTAKA